VFVLGQIQKIHHIKNPHHLFHFSAVMKALKQCQGVNASGNSEEWQFLVILHSPTHNPCKINEMKSCTIGKKECECNGPPATRDEHLLGHFCQGGKEVFLSMHTVIVTLGQCQGRNASGDSEEWQFLVILHSPTHNGVECLQTDRPSNTKENSVCRAHWQNRIIRLKTSFTQSVAVLVTVSSHDSSSRQIRHLSEECEK